MSQKNDIFTYHHNFDDYSVKLELELSVYVPRGGRDSEDDCRELEILKATVMEDIENEDGTFAHKKGDSFDIKLIDEEDVADEYFGNGHEYDDYWNSRVEDAIEEDRKYRYGE